MKICPACTIRSIKGSNDLNPKLMFTLDQESSNRITRNSNITITGNTYTF